MALLCCSFISTALTLLLVNWVVLKVGKVIVFVVELDYVIFYCTTDRIATARYNYLWTPGKHPCIVLTQIVRWSNAYFLISSLYCVLTNAQLWPLVLLSLLHLQLPSQAEANGKVFFRFRRYENTHGLLRNGHCCDGRWRICQSNGCDYKFSFCLGLRR